MIESIEDRSATDRGPRGEGRGVSQSKSAVCRDRGVSQSRIAVCHDRGSRCRGDRGSRCVTIIEDRGVAIEDRGVAIEGRGVAAIEDRGVCHDRGSRCRGDRGSRCVTIIEDRGVAIEDRDVAIEDRGVANNYKRPKFCPVRRSIFLGLICVEFRKNLPFKSYGVEKPICK